MTAVVLYISPIYHAVSLPLSSLEAPSIWAFPVMNAIFYPAAVFYELMRKRLCRSALWMQERRRSEEVEHNEF